MTKTMREAREEFERNLLIWKRSKLWDLGQQ